MWYTHYCSNLKTDLVDELYEKLLDEIKTDEWETLLNLIKKHEKDWKNQKEVDEYFHDYAYNTEKWHMTLVEDFTKTARKRYDVAVLLAYLALHIIEWDELSWDWEDENVRPLEKHLALWNVNSAAFYLQEYIENESIDIELSDEEAEKLVKLTIDFIKENWVGDPDYYMETQDF